MKTKSSPYSVTTEVILFDIFQYFITLAGKTTTISMLTGLVSPDYSFGEEKGAFVYGNNILTEMDQIRYSMGERTYSKAKDFIILYRY